MNTDPLLTAIHDARQRKDTADNQLRLLLAYSREVITPRPYRLADLAKAARMSISGVRAGYSPADVAHAAALAEPDTRHAEAAVTRLLASAQHGTTPDPNTAT